MSSYSEGQIHQVANCLEKAGYTADDVTKMIQEKEYLQGLWDVMNGGAEIKTITPVIDCDAPVFVPDGWEVLPDSEQLPNRIRGKIVFDPKKTSLFFPEEEKTGSIIGHDFRKKLADKPVFNANVLDYLLTHIALIPKGCMSKDMYFFGTIYRDSDGLLRVRCMSARNSRCRWVQGDYCLNWVFCSDIRAALLAS